MYDLIIIGGGPSGLTAALYAARAGVKSLLIEKALIGGQVLLTEIVDNFPGFPDGIKSFDLMDRMKKQIETLKVETKLEEVRNIDKKNKFTINTDKTTYESSALILAVGSSHKKLNIPGELSLTGKGVSYCAVCDAPFFKQKDVAVVGGGDAALEEALYLARFARKVKIIHRRDKLRAVKILQDRVKACKNIEIFFNSQPVEISGENKVRSVIVKNTISGSQEDISADGVFIFIGYVPNTDFLKDFIKLDENGFVITNDQLAVGGMEGVFACGDCLKKELYQIITACSEGALAAHSAQKYIYEKKISYTS